MKIETTDKYHLFKLIEHNRTIKEPHVNRIMESMKVQELTNPIIVNEKMEIVDGQHRFEALRRLGKPITYMVVKGYDEEQVRRYNINTKNWSLNDYHEHFVKRGDKWYIALRDFMTKYNFNLMAGRVFTTKQYGKKDGFVDGSYKIDIPQYEKLATLFNRIKDTVVFNPYSRNFCVAIRNIGLVPECDYERLIKVFIRSGHTLKKQTNTELFCLEIEKMYNKGCTQRVELYKRKL
jgi:hypothetical protein